MVHIFHVNVKYTVLIAQMQQLFLKTQRRFSVYGTCFDVSSILKFIQWSLWTKDVMHLRWSTTLSITILLCCWLCGEFCTSGVIYVRQVLFQHAFHFPRFNSFVKLMKNTLLMYQWYSSNKCTFWWIILNPVLIGKKTQIIFASILIFDLSCNCHFGWLTSFVLFYRNMYHLSFLVGKRLGYLVQNQKRSQSGLWHQWT